MTKVHNAVVSSIARKIVNGVDTIARVKSFRRIVVGTIFRQMERYVNIATIFRRVCAIGDKILVETIVATIHEQAGDTLTFGIELIYGKWCSTTKHRGFVVFQNFSYAIVFNIIAYGANGVLFARIKLINYLYLLTLTLSLNIYVGMHIAPIAHSHRKGCRRSVGKQGVVDYRRLTNIAQCAVYPFCGVTTRKGICSQWYSEQRKPFCVRSLLNISRQRRRIETRKFRLHLYFVEQIIALRYVLGARACR